MLPPRIAPAPARALGVAALVLGLVVPAPLLGAAAAPPPGSSPAAPPASALSAGASGEVGAGASEGDGVSRRSASALTRRIAQRAGISLAAAEELRTSENALVQPDGAVAIVDDFEGHDGHTDHDGHGEPSPEVATASAASAVSTDRDARAARAARRAEARSVDVLALHSDPGASQTIFLDFDGAELRDTAWNQGGTRGLPPGTYGGYSEDQDPAFSLYERQKIIEVWRETSAYFAAFDIDVTTQHPPRARIARDGVADREFGSWVVISSDGRVPPGVCGGCTGIATVGLYDSPEGGQWGLPAFSFLPEAFVIAHEVGHTMGLLHDGGPDGRGGTEEYYRGHGLWAPIMGQRGLSPDSVRQWSRGEYAGATNTQDDYAVMQQHGAVLRADGAGATTATAASRLGQESLAPGDVDVFALPACSGTLTTVAEVPDGGGLDVTLELLDGTGATLSRAGTPITLELPAPLAPQREGQGEVLVDRSGSARFARVTPGSAPGPDGYPAYGSVGGYRIDSRCDAPAPGAPTNLQVTTSYRQAFLTWDAPAAGLVTGYRVTVGDQSQVVPAGVRRFAGFAIADTGVRVSVEALTGSLAGPAVGTTLSFPPTPTVRLATPAVDRQRGVATIAWDATVAPQITDATWQLVNGETGEELVGLPVGTRSADLGVLAPDGSLDVELCLLIPLRGNSRFQVCDTRSATYAPVAAAPEALALSSTDTRGGVGATWSPVAGATGYEISVEMGPWRAVTLPARLADVEPGWRSVRVRALTAAGPGSAARGSVEVRRAPTPPRDLVAVPSADGTSLTLRWREPEDARDLTGYELFVQGQDNGYPLPAGTTSYTLTGLTPGSRVDVFLRAVGGNAGSESVYLATLMPRGEEPPEPGEPGVLPVPRLDSVTPGAVGKPHAIDVEFSATPHPSVTVTGWELRFTATGKPKRSTVVTVAPGTRSVSVYLPRKRTWRVQVRAIGAGGAFGGWSVRSAAVRPG